MQHCIKEQKENKFCCNKNIWQLIKLNVLNKLNALFNVLSAMIKKHTKRDELFNTLNT